jgi:DNA polymerase III delta prime subunit
MQSFLWVSGSSDKRDSLREKAKSEVSQFDLFYNDCSANSSIEVVRDLKRFLSRKPLQSEFNLGLLTEAHNLSLEAQNALLKTLEEPPGLSRIILTATNTSSLLPTIISRCEVVEAEIINENPPLNWELVEKIINGNDATRIKEADEVDINQWILSWQQLLKAKIKGQEVSLSKNLTVEQIRNYLKKLLSFNRMKESNVNSKLLSSVMLLSAPKPAS